MNLTFKKMLLGVLILASPEITDCFGQVKTFKVIDDSVSITVVGESTLHDWTVSVSNTTNYPAELNLTPANGEVIDGFSFQIEVASMDGGRGSAMNDKIYTALQSGSFPTITYAQDGSALIKMQGDQNFLLTSNGLLTVAGGSKQISIEVAGTINNGLLMLKASKALKMSDFGIDPPSAMFGQIQTKDDIVANIKFTYQLN